MDPYTFVRMAFEIFCYTFAAFGLPFLALYCFLTGDIYVGLVFLIGWIAFMYFFVKK